MSDSAARTPRPRGRPRKDSRPADAPTTKQEILAAASEAFAASGFDGAGLVEIATAAGVTTGAVYCHYDDKAQLLYEVMSTALDTVARPLRRDVGSGPQALHDWLNWMMAPEQLQLRALVAEIHHAALRDLGVRRLLDDYGREYQTLVGGLIATWQGDGTLAADGHANSLALLFLTLALGLCTTGSLQPTLLDNESFRRTLDTEVARLFGEPAS